MTSIKAIETRYAGCHFRSRLEARWAVFFDSLGITWEYEPQGFELPSGRYLPDFWLPELSTWYEVKGTEPNDIECRLMFELAFGMTWEDASDLLPDAYVNGGRVICAFGDIPRADKIDNGGFGSTPNSMILDGGCDDSYQWCRCPNCGRFGIEFEARGSRVCPVEPGGRGHNGTDPVILAAYTAARSARFEHGQSGAA